MHSKNEPLEDSSDKLNESLFRSILQQNNTNKVNNPKTASKNLVMETRNEIGSRENFSR